MRLFITDFGALEPLIMPSETPFQMENTSEYSVTGSVIDSYGQVPLNPTE